MDVSAIASGSGTTGSPTPTVSGSTTGVTPPTAPDSDATPLLSATPIAPPGETQPKQLHSGIAPAIAKLFGNSSTPQPITLNVSYRVVKDLNEIVTVFSDPKTGKEVAQFPPELLIGLAQFFDHERGVTLDESA